MIFSKVVHRLQQPAGVLTWRYVTHRQDPIIAHHWRAFWFVPAGLPRLIVWCFACLQQLAWWLYFGWRAFFRIWKKRDKWKITDSKISSFRIISDLCYLTFAYTIPPYHYFAFQLYKYPKAQWLSFIYEHESSKWLQSLSGE